MKQLLALLVSYFILAKAQVVRSRHLARTLTGLIYGLLLFCANTSLAINRSESKTRSHSASGLRCSEAIFFNHESVFLGRGTTSEVFMVREDGKQPYVRKEYRANADRVNDELAFDYLRRLLSTVSGKAVGFKVIKVLPGSIRVAGERSLLLEYRSGYELAAAAKLRPSLREAYIVRLQRLDAILRKSGHLTQRFRFSYGGLPAIQYSFSANRDFEIIIHAKNILVNEQEFVIIDPY